MRSLRRSGALCLTLCRAVRGEGGVHSRGGAGGQRTGPPSPSPLPQTAWCNLSGLGFQVLLLQNSRQKLVRRRLHARRVRQAGPPSSPRFKGMYQRRVRKCSQPFPSVAALRLAPKCGLRTPARTPRRPAPSAQEPPNRTRRACASRARRAMETVDLKLVLLGTSRRAHPGPALPWRGTPVVRVAPRAPRSSGSLHPVHSAAAGRPQTPLCPLLRRSARRG